MQLKQLLSKFKKVKQGKNGEYSCLCPAHEDKHSSLNITTKEDKILICCHVGCDTKNVMSAVGLKMTDLFLDTKEEETSSDKTYTVEEIKNWPWVEKVYLYPNKENQDYMLVVRFKNKDFRQYSYVGDGKYKAGLNKKTPVIYRLPEVILGIKKNLVICIAEGEKDADNIVKHFKMPATTVPGGCGGGWRKHYNQYFKDAKVILLPDNDDPGRKLMKTIAENLYSVAKEVRLLELPGIGQKCDVSDWIDNGGDRPHFMKLIAGTQKYTQKTLCVKNTDITFYTDTWNGEEFVRKYGDIIRYCDEWKKWFIWDERKWKEDNTRKIQSLAKETVRSLYNRISEVVDDKERNTFLKHIQNSESMTKRRFMVEAATSESNVPVTPDIFDHNKMILNLRNGELDLKTGILKEHNKENYITKMVDINYNPDAKCPTWIGFLNKFFNNNQKVIQFIQNAVGYSLTGLTIEQCIFILHGNGSNGKSTFVNIIKEIMGEYAQQTPSETLMEKKNTGNATNDLARLRGTRFVASVETEQGRSFAEALVKQISGDDTISARFLHKEFFEFKPECKIWIATNHKPKIKNTDHAIWRRIKLIEFAVTIPDEEKDLLFTDKLRLEKEGILTWMVQGCLNWQANGLQEPDEVKASTKNYREEMDVIGTFIEENCVIGLGYRSTAKELYDCYSNWCEENGEYVLSQRIFGLKLSERGYEREKCFSGYNRGKHIYIGIGILDTISIAPLAPLAPEKSLKSHTCMHAYNNSDSLGASGARGADKKCDDEDEEEMVSPF